MKARIPLFFLTLLFSLSLISQEKEPRLYSTNLLTTRYMQTVNQGDAEDFSILVTWIKPTFHYRITDWLSIHGASVVLLNYGTNSIKKRDAATGDGPIYEGNLWNQRLMDGSIASSLPELHLDFAFGDHFFRIGRFLENTPAINAEPWPFPNALEGIWYKFEQEHGLKLQLGLIDRISPRFGVEFFDVGNSIGAGPIGVGLDGLPGQYRGNVNSNYMSILNLAFPVTQGMTLALWNYQVEEVSNTLFVETKFDLNKEKGLKLAVQYIRQDQLGDGGNIDPMLSYFTDKQANSFGWSLSKSLKTSEFSLNFTRIGNQGRLLLPRDWGVEPFYTFQRRHRVEGMRDLTALMFKWQNDIEQEKQDFKVFSSIAHTWAKSPAEPENNKYQLPSNLNWDASIKYMPKGNLKGISAELFMAYRFLTDKNSDLPIYTINRANFFHSDVIVSYVF